MKEIPNIAHIHLDVDLNLKNWLTEDDKESIIENAKNQEEIDTYIESLLADNIDTVLNYKSINIEFE